jgi:predicted porin
LLKQSEILYNKQHDIMSFFKGKLHMKNLLLATILTTGALAAQAQQTTVYGVIDTSVQSYNNGTSQYNRMADSQLGTSRLGFRGTEVLGNGLKANFQLEGQLNPSGGSMGSTTVATNEIFNRDSYVGLSGAFGEFRLGRTDVARAGEVDVTILLPIVGNYGLMPINGTGVELGTDQKNVVTYLSPEINGVQVIVGHATNASGATTDANSDQNGITVVYTRGAFKGAVGYQRNDAATEVGKKDATTIGASYDFGAVIVAVAHAQGDNSATATVTSKSTNYVVKVPLANGYAVSGIYGKTVDGASSANNNGESYTLLATKSLSKRTTLYTAYTDVRNESKSSMRTFNGTAPSAAGLDTRSLVFGINHSF